MRRITIFLCCLLVLLIAVPVGANPVTQVFQQTVNAADGAFSTGACNLPDCLTTTASYSSNGGSQYWSPGAISSTTTGQLAHFQRAASCIDTSALAGKTILSAQIGVYGLLAANKSENGAGTFGISGFHPANRKSLIASDFGAGDAVSWITPVDNSSFYTGRYNNFTVLNPALINTTGETCFMSRFDDWDIHNNQATFVWKNSGQTTYGWRDYYSGASTAEFVSVTYESTPPISIFTSQVMTWDTPIIAAFNSTSTGAPTGYAWTIQKYDGNNTAISLGTGNSAQVTLDEVGKWLVNLTVTNSDGTNTNSSFFNISYTAAQRSNLAAARTATGQLFPPDFAWNTRVDQMHLPLL